jgi:sulfoacetaldehyde dehydrogenase
MTTETSSVMVEVGDLIRRARQAQETIERYTHQQVDALTTAVGWSVVRQDRAEALAKLAVDEGGFGNYPDKVTKIRNRIMGTLADIARVKTVGVVEEIPEQGLIKIAKPVGVVAALIPRPSCCPGSSGRRLGTGSARGRRAGGHGCNDRRMRAGPGRG